MVSVKVIVLIKVKYSVKVKDQFKGKMKVLMEVAAKFELKDLVNLRTVNRMFQDVPRPFSSKNGVR